MTENKSRRFTLAEIEVGKQYTFLVGPWGAQERWTGTVVNKGVAFGIIKLTFEGQGRGGYARGDKIVHYSELREPAPDDHINR